MAGRLAINTVIYSRAFISKTWVSRAELTEYERRGFFNFLYVTACGHAESVISDYLKAILFWPRMEIKRMSDKGFPFREVVNNDISSLISIQYEQLAVKRLIEKAIEDIEKAPFEKLVSLHNTVVGYPLKHIVGDDLFDHLKGLVSVRNLLAHGRQLYIDLDDSFIADVGFEQHPLENAIKSLRQVKLFVEEHARNIQPNDVNSVIYDENVVVHFWNASTEIPEIYINRANQEGLLTFGAFHHAIPKLTL